MRIAITHEMVRLETAGVVLQEVPTASFARAFFHTDRALSGLLSPSLRWIGRQGLGVIVEMAPHSRRIFSKTTVAKTSSDGFLITPSAWDAIIPLPWTIVGLRYSDAMLSRLEDVRVFARSLPIGAVSDELYRTWMPMINPDASVHMLSDIRQAHRRARTKHMQVGGWSLAAAIDAVLDSIITTRCRDDSVVAVPITPPSGELSDARQACLFLASQPLAEVLTWPLERSTTMAKLMGSLEPTSSRPKTTTEVFSTVVEAAAALATENET